MVVYLCDLRVHPLDIFLWSEIKNLIDDVPINSEGALTAAELKIQTTNIL